MIGDAVGASEQNVKDLFAVAEGKVVIIDEAYILDDSGYGKDVINAMLTCVRCCNRAYHTFHFSPLTRCHTRYHIHRHTTNPNIAVILLGYPSEMEKMMRDQNPGFRGRFDWDRRFKFEDYTKDELDAIVFGIIDRKDGVIVPRSVRRALSSRLESMRDSVPNFRNAAEAKAMIDQVLARARARQKREHIDGTDVVITIEDLTSSEESALLSAGPLAPLKSLIRMETISTKLEVRPSLCLDNNTLFPSPHRALFLPSLSFSSPSLVFLTRPACLLL
mgnify:CR=1 FL=1